MLATLTERSICEEVYEDVKGLIWTTVRRFCDTYGEADFEEYLSEASLDFVNGFICHRKGEGHERIEAEIYRWVWYSLYDRYRVRKGLRAKNRRNQVADYDFSRCSKEEPTFSTSEFLEDLSEDARIVASLTIDTPAEILEIVAAKGDNRRTWTTAIKSYLTGLGWAADRIKESWDEVTEALGS